MLHLRARAETVLTWHEMNERKSNVNPCSPCPNHVMCKANTLSPGYRPEYFSWNCLVITQIKLLLFPHGFPSRCKHIVRSTYQSTDQEDKSYWDFYQPQTSLHYFRITVPWDVQQSSLGKLQTTYNSKVNGNKQKYSVRNVNVWLKKWNIENTYPCKYVWITLPKILILVPFHHKPRRYRPFLYDSVEEYDWNSRGRINDFLM